MSDEHNYKDTIKEAAGLPPDHLTEEQKLRAEAADDHSLFESIAVLPALSTPFNNNEATGLVELELASELLYKYNEQTFGDEAMTGDDEVDERFE